MLKKNSWFLEVDVDPVQDKHPGNGSFANVLVVADDEESAKNRALSELTERGWIPIKVTSVHKILHEHPDPDLSQIKMLAELELHGFSFEICFYPDKDLGSN